MNLLRVRQGGGVGSLWFRGLLGLGALGQQGACEQGKRGVGGFHAAKVAATQRRVVVILSFG